MTLAPFEGGAFASVKKDCVGEGQYQQPAKMEECGRAGSAGVPLQFRRSSIQSLDHPSFVLWCTGRSWS